MTVRLLKTGMKNIWKNILYCEEYIPCLPIVSYKNPRNPFSTVFLGIMIWCPHPRHFKRKSMPTRRISHLFSPQGCGFFIFICCPIEKSILSTPFMNVIQIIFPSNRKDNSNQSIRQFIKFCNEYCTKKRDVLK